MRPEVIMLRFRRGPLAGQYMPAPAWWDFGQPYRVHEESDMLRAVAMPLAPAPSMRVITYVQTAQIHWRGQAQLLRQWNDIVPGLFTGAWVDEWEIIMEPHR